jgi:hypothetical protein
MESFIARCGIGFFRRRVLAVALDEPKVYPWLRGKHCLEELARTPAAEAGLVASRPPLPGAQAS